MNTVGLSSSLDGKISLPKPLTNWSAVLRFSDEEIEVARQLRRDGLSWEPKAGHYVYDETGFCKQGSPFQEKVYFILNYPYFMRAVGGLQRFKEIMLWLPTWDDVREILRDLDIDDEEVARFLRERRAIEAGQERLALYEYVHSRLTEVSVSRSPIRESDDVSSLSVTDIGQFDSMRVAGGLAEPHDGDENP